MRLYRYHNANCKPYRAILDNNIVLADLTFKSEDDIDIVVGYLHTSILKARNSSVPTSKVNIGVGKLPVPLIYLWKLIKYKKCLRRLDNNSPNGP